MSATTVLGVAIITPNNALANRLLPNEQCAVIVMASKDTQLVLDSLRKYQDIAPASVVIESNNGFFAAALGVFSKTDGASFIKTNLSAGRLPKDAYCGNTERYVRLIYPNADFSALVDQPVNVASESSQTIPAAPTEAKLAAQVTKESSPQVPDIQQDSSTLPQPLREVDNATATSPVRARAIAKAVQDEAVGGDLKPCLIYRHKYPFENDLRTRRDAKQYENNLSLTDGVEPSYLITKNFVFVYMKTFVKDPSNSVEARSKLSSLGSIFMDRSSNIIDKSMTICDERVNPADTLASWAEVEKAYEKALRERLAKAVPPPPLENNTDDKTLRDAYGFMLGGDKGWDIANGYHIENCKIRYTPKGTVVRLDVTHDLNMAQWKSATVKFVDLKPNFYVACSGKCITQRAYTDNPDLLGFVSLQDGLEQNFIQYPINVTQERFKGALQDVVKRCSGSESKY